MFRWSSRSEPKRTHTVYKQILQKQYPSDAVLLQLLLQLTLNGFIADVAYSYSRALRGLSHCFAPSVPACSDLGILHVSIRSALWTQWMCALLTYCAAWTPWKCFSWALGMSASAATPGARSSMQTAAGIDAEASLCKIVRTANFWAFSANSSNSQNLRS